MRRLALFLSALAGSTLMPAAADALMTATAGATQQVSTASLSAPTNLDTGPGDCTPNTADSAVVTWTPPSPTKATGYEIMRATSSSGPYQSVGTVAGSTAAEYEDSGLAFDAVYYYKVRSTTATWHSADSAGATRATRNADCT